MLPEPATVGAEHGITVCQTFRPGRSEDSDFDSLRRFAKFAGQALDAEANRRGSVSSCCRGSILFHDSVGPTSVTHGSTLRAAELARPTSETPVSIAAELATTDPR